MTGISRYTDLLQRGTIRQYHPIPVSSFTVRVIAELLREGYVYPHYYQGVYTIRAGLGAEDL